MSHRSKVEFPGFRLTSANKSYMLRYIKRLSEVLIFCRCLCGKIHFFYEQLFCASTAASEIDQPANSAIIGGWKLFSHHIMVDTQKIRGYLRLFKRNFSRPTVRLLGIDDIK